MNLIAQLITITFLATNSLQAATCQIFNTNGSLASEKGDILYQTLSQGTCPKEISAFKEKLEGLGLKIQNAMVANRGRLNSKWGSFSFFETVTGSLSNLKVLAHHLYFGHFTHAKAGLLKLDSTPSPGKLMIELIAWDFKKEVYNFYELIGVSSTDAKWFYRGDSFDAILDNKNLHLGSLNFGKRMRCSGCHANGGPIMKEIDAPHNDWWTESKPLIFTPNSKDNTIEAQLSETKNSEAFAESVQAGINALVQSPSYIKFLQERPFPEIIRPLFCTEEINVISDSSPDSRSISISTKAFLNPIMALTKEIKVDRELYRQGLKELRFKFPEISALDADHAWLTPVKSTSDIAEIKALLEYDHVSFEMVQAILAIDLKEPMFSRVRCSLLKFVPKVHSADWQAKFMAALETNQPELFLELNSYLADHSLVNEKVSLFEKELKNNFKSLKGIKAELKRLEEKRKSVFSSDISKNPLGQILEPGFRVIFPMMQ